MEPSLTISHISKDSYGTALSTCDIKSLYTFIRHDLLYTVVDYWTEKLQNALPLLQRFNKQIIVDFFICNYF